MSEPAGLPAEFREDWKMVLEWEEAFKDQWHRPNVKNIVARWRAALEAVARLRAENERLVARIEVERQVSLTAARISDELRAENERLQNLIHEMDAADLERTRRIAAKDAALLPFSQIADTMMASTIEHQYWPNFGNLCRKAREARQA